ncbi:uncharacterized protein LOC106668871 isoform X2 [Cimex lectularius]|uniref:Uncharacterized protein n=1 Tax=Cimex lectularius TaxID=79782 RepID=A0A8I6TFZ6_CIMLE|nr:uncharacterized protein LOC106668871 isoform X2 [Cimex lectularius]
MSRNMKHLKRTGMYGTLSDMHPALPVRPGEIQKGPRQDEDISQVNVFRKAQFKIKLGEKVRLAKLKLAVISLVNSPQNTPDCSDLVEKMSTINIGCDTDVD